MLFPEFLLQDWQNVPALSDFENANFPKSRNSSQIHFMTEKYIRLQQSQSI